jgi:molybdate transport system substrate-binding protein
MRRFLVLLLSLAASTAAQAQQPLVFAAASLKNALDDIAALSPARLTLAFGPSSGLARQIENGAPAQLFISADLDWMDYLQQRNLIRTASRRNLLGNKLVLIAPADSRVKADIGPGFPLAALLGSGRLATADPAAVPAGKYTRAALEKFGVWNSVAGKLAPADSVRAALLLVARGEAPLGTVYATDAAVEPRVRIVGAFPDGSHPPIIYPAALTASAPAAGPAADFLALLSSPAARKLFEKYGFTPLN